MIQHISSDKILHVYRSTEYGSVNFGFHIILLRGPLSELQGEYGAASLVAVWIGKLAEKILNARAHVSVWGSSIRISIDAPLDSVDRLSEFVAAIAVYPAHEHEIFRSAALSDLKTALTSDAIEFQNTAFSKRWIGRATETFRTSARVAALQTITPEAVCAWLARNWNRENVVCVGVTNNEEAEKQFRKFCVELPTGVEASKFNFDVAPAYAHHTHGNFVGVSVPIRASATIKDFWMAHALADHIQYLISKKVEVASYVDGEGSALLFWTRLPNDAQAAEWISSIKDAFKKAYTWNLFEEEMIRNNFRVDFETMRTQLQNDASQLEMIIESIQMIQCPVDPHESLNAIERVTDSDMREFAQQLFDEAYIQDFSKLID